MKKKYRKIHRAVNRFRPYDYGFILEIEKKCLEELRDYLGKEGIAVGNDRDAERINTAIKCLGIFDYPDFDLKGNKIIPRHYINIGNYDRFIPVVNEDIIQTGAFKVSLREQKAWHLYCMIREYFMQQWWD